MASQLRMKLSVPFTWGGKRKGAGRPLAPGRRPSVPHRARPGHKTAHPVHVTLRACSGIPSLRSPRAFPAVKRALSAASRSAFRLVHFSVQSDHVHMIVEAHDKPALSRGLQGLSIRTARATNRALHRAPNCSGQPRRRGADPFT